MSHSHHLFVNPLKTGRPVFDCVLAFNNAACGKSNGLTHSIDKAAGRVYSGTMEFCCFSEVSINLGAIVNTSAKMPLE